MSTHYPLGVSKDKKTEFYHATVTLPSGDQRCVGRFLTERKAAVAHDTYMRFYHRDSTQYIPLNFPTENVSIATVSSWKQRKLCKSSPLPKCRTRGVERKLSKSGHVYWYATSRVAKIKANIGSFRTEKDAARAVDTYRRRLGYIAINYPELPSIEFEALRIDRPNSADKKSSPFTGVALQPPGKRFKEPRFMVRHRVAGKTTVKRNVTNEQIAAMVYDNLQLEAGRTVVNYPRLNLERQQECIK